MSYGELTLPPITNGRNPLNGHFLKGHVPANKGKSWSEYMTKRGQKRAMKGWANLDKCRSQRSRPDNAGRCRKKVIAVTDNGRFTCFQHIGAAAEWCDGLRENVGRCCRMNQSRHELRNTNGQPLGKVNTDHRYKGVRFYFESDNIWLKKIKQ